MVPWIIDGVLVGVDNLDRHFKRAKAAGATILSEIEEDPPGRRYRAEDFEGHRWFFFEHRHSQGNSPRARLYGQGPCLFRRLP